MSVPACMCAALAPLTNPEAVAAGAGLGVAGGGLESSFRAKVVSPTPAEAGGPPLRVGRRG